MGMLTGDMRPVAASFVLFGAYWGSWAVAAADVERELGVSHAGFGLLLSAALLIGAAANAVGGTLAERLGTTRLLAVALATWGVLLPFGALAQHPFAIGAVVVGVVGTAGLIDVVMNVAATAALADRPGALVRFHALFNAGAAAGAASMGILVASGHTWRPAWAVIGVVALAVALVVARSRLPAGSAGKRLPLAGALSVLRREHLVLIAAAFAVGSMVEGGVELWGVLFLRTTLPNGLAIGATSATVAYAIAALTRVVLGPLVGRRGPIAGVATGGATAAMGILLLGLAPGRWLPGAGLVLAAGGISLCWPLLLAYASAGRDRPGAAVGGVTAIGYLGFVAGPAIVGWIAAIGGLRAGIVLLSVAAVFVAVVPAASHRASAAKA
jgi:MFS family permease